MMRLTVFLPSLLACLLGCAAAGPVRAGPTMVDMMTISGTVGQQRNHLCFGTGTQEIGCAGRNFYVTPNGYVGIGTATPTVQLEISGSVNAAGSSIQTSSTYLYADTATLYSMSPLTPSGLVAGFNLASCPSGWTAWSSGAGRVIVGVGTLGADTYTLNGTGGSATVVISGNQMAAHTHSIDPPETTTTSEGSHTHTFNPSSATIPADGNSEHSHLVTLPNTTARSAGAHDHYFQNGDGYRVSFKAGTASVADANFRAIQVSDLTEGERMGNYNTTNFELTTTDGSHTHTYYNIPSFTSASGGGHSHSYDIGSFTSGAGSSHTHSIDIASFDTGSVGSGTPLDVRGAYIGLLYCKKN